MWYLAFNAPAKYTRLLLMELGLEGLIVKIEEYVGKRVTLVAIWLLLIWLFCESTIAMGQWVGQVMLGWEFLNNPEYTSHLLLIQSALVLIFIALSTFVLIYGIRLRFFIKRSMRYILKDCETAAKHRKAITDAIEQYNQRVKE